MEIASLTFYMILVLRVGAQFTLYKHTPAIHFNAVKINSSFSLLKIKSESINNLSIGVFSPISLALKNVSGWTPSSLFGNVLFTIVIHACIYIYMPYRSSSLKYTRSILQTFITISTLARSLGEVCFFVFFPSSSAAFVFIKILSNTLSNCMEWNICFIRSFLRIMAYVKLSTCFNRSLSWLLGEAQKFTTDCT